MKWYEPLKAEKADRRGEYVSLGEAFEAPLLAWRRRGLWVDEMESTVLQPQGSEFFQQPEMSLETKSSSKPLDKSSDCLNQDFSHRSLRAAERVGPLRAGTSDPLWDNKWIFFSSYLFILDGGDVLVFFFFFEIYLFCFLAVVGVRCWTWAFFSFRDRGLRFVTVGRLLTSVVSLLQSMGSQGAWAQQVGSSWTRDPTGVPSTSRQILNCWNTKEPNLLIFNWRRIIMVGWFLQIFLFLITLWELPWRSSGWDFAFPCWERQG